MKNIIFILLLSISSININSMEMKRRISQDISSEIFKHSENSPFKKFKRDTSRILKPIQLTSKEGIKIKESDPYKMLLTAVRENNRNKALETIAKLVSSKQKTFIKEGATAFKEAKKNNRYLYLLMVQHEYDCRMMLLETESYQESFE